MFSQKLKFIFLFSCFFAFLFSTFLFISPVWAFDCQCPSFSGPVTTEDAEACSRYCESETGKATTEEEKAEAAPTCVITPECEARWKETEKGILSQISKECYCCGDCGLNDFVNLFVSGANYLLGIVGALALLFFIYGGVLWLTAGGKAEQIDKGKKILIGAVIGLAIIFGSWILVQFIMTAFGVKSEFLKMFKATR